ncbi:uncharacterized protein PHACADRAFT_255256 [Phanerochaete carnosa HHB-10118-sp]|uniref:Uncharacterized protein n=1 Tax=Phanerochaete carnosa (strain HHB-10118-sp) TaxID=650164 RepID=K5VU09_PHACS|nr:uncharacterized protein PHACADRAFT_255256 [Phanerochaete carnosa HHB-10118-sp]EKM54988.1 hypothetical protein PHACADRAFT_255256 [Phanerochaete carnosa HHB-10118-sp]
MSAVGTPTRAPNGRRDIRGAPAHGASVAGFVDKARKWQRALLSWYPSYARTELPALGTQYYLLLAEPGSSTYRHDLNGEHRPHARPAAPNRPAPSQHIPPEGSERGVPRRRSAEVITKVHFRLEARRGSGRAETPLVESQTRWSGARALDHCYART